MLLYVPVSAKHNTIMQVVPKLEIITAIVAHLIYVSFFMFFLVLPFLLTTKRLVSYVWICTRWEYPTRTRGGELLGGLFLLPRINLRFLLRNKGVLKEYTLMWISPFLTLYNKVHEVHLDNIYMRAKCFHLSYTYNNCVKLQGVSRNGGQGIQRELFQAKF